MQHFTKAKEKNLLLCLRNGLNFSLNGWIQRIIKLFQFVIFQENNENIFLIYIFEIFLKYICVQLLFFCFFLQIC